MVDKESPALKKGRQIASLLSKAGLPMKECLVVNKGNRVNYTRGDKLLECINNNTSKISEIYHENGESLSPISIAQKLLRENLMVKFERVTEEKKFLWPRKLALVNNNSFDEKAFYTWTFPLSSRNHAMILFFVVALVLMLLLFPIWPLKLKIAVWYIGVFLVLIFFGIVVIRYLLYIVLWICSCEFWLFPNLFADDKGPIDSLIPAFVFSLRKGDTFAMKFARLVCLALLIFVGYSIVKKPKIVSDFSNVGVAISNVLEWGHLKLEGNVSSQATDGKPRLVDLEDIFPTADKQDTTNEDMGQAEAEEEDDDKI